MKTYFSVLLCVLDLWFWRGIPNVLTQNCILESSSLQNMILLLFSSLHYNMSLYTKLAPFRISFSVCFRWSWLLYTKLQPQPHPKPGTETLMEPRSNHTRSVLRLTFALKCKCAVALKDKSQLQQVKTQQQITKHNQFSRLWRCCMFVLYYPNNLVSCLNAWLFFPQQNQLQIWTPLNYLIKSM